MKSGIIAVAVSVWIGGAAAATPSATPNAEPVAEPAATPVGPWSTRDERLLFGPADISLPVTAADANLISADEFSRKGEGVDSVARYRTPDESITATVYIYYPSIAHAGLQALSTDQGIRRPATPPVVPLGNGVAAAGGKAGVALTADYTRYMGRLSSKSAFIKAGRWMVKIRVSGPEARAAEVEAIRAGLLGAMRFEGKVQPRPAAPIAEPECPPSETPAARLLPADFTTDAEAAITGVLDATGEVARAKRGSPSTPFVPRIGSSWCRSTLAAGETRLLLLRATDAGDQSRSPEAKSVLLLPYSDSGGVFEVVRLKGGRGYRVLDHNIALLKVLGTFDALPSDEQLRGLFRKDGEQNRVRATVRFKADGSAEIEVVEPPKKASPRT